MECWVAPKLDPTYVQLVPPANAIYYAELIELLWSVPMQAKIMVGALCLVAALGSVARADPPTVGGKAALPKARTGVDDDSVRPVAPGVSPGTRPPLAMPKVLPKRRIGVDDDSVRPVLPKGEPLVRR
jgi:hypothetical protein